MNSYWLPRHVWLCCTEDAGIWLDAKKDRYSGVSLEKLLSLRDVLIGGQRLSPRVCVHVSAPPFDSNFCEELTAQGLLTSDPTLGREYTPPTIQPPDCSFRLDGSKVAGVSFADVYLFVRAFTITTVLLHGHSLHLALEHVRRKKTALKASPGIDTRNVVARTRAFAIIRSFFYTAESHCLFDSLALFEFLAGHSVRSDLVVGVRTGPFQAHAWVQAGNVALNGEAAYCRSFYPILHI
jgi:hypothetical protein